MTRGQVVEALKRCIQDPSYGTCTGCPYEGVGDTFAKCCLALMLDCLDLLKAPEPRVMTLDLPDAEWRDKALWLEKKKCKKIVLCVYRDCSDRIMFGRRERLVYFDVVGSAMDDGYMLKNYGVKWRCWDKRPTDEQMEATPWAT